MYALQESVRQMRGNATSTSRRTKISVCHGVGGMFAASGTIIFSRRRRDRRESLTAEAAAAAG
jgi:hypothetical protein